MLVTDFNPTDTQDAVRLSRSWEKAQRLGRDGYAIYQAPYSCTIRFYFVQKPAPESTVYLVNTDERTCTCEDFRRNARYCKHILFVARCEAYAATL
jgi:hypothetical protein